MDNGKIDWPYELKPEEREGSITDRYIQPLLDGMKSAAISDSLYDWARSIDNKTLLQLVAERGASAGAQEIIRVTTWYSDREGKASAAWNLLPVLQSVRSKDVYSFPGGVDNLSTAFTVRLAEIVSIFSVQAAIHSFRFRNFAQHRIIKIRLRRTSIILLR